MFSRVRGPELTSLGADSGNLRQKIILNPTRLNPSLMPGFALGSVVQEIRATLIASEAIKFLPRGLVEGDRLLKSVPHAIIGFPLLPKVQVEHMIQTLQCSDLHDGVKDRLKPHSIELDLTLPVTAIDLPLSTTDKCFPVWGQI
jgi:hypothetical protein